MLLVAYSHQSLEDIRILVVTKQMKKCKLSFWNQSQVLKFLHYKTQFPVKIQNLWDTW